MKWMTAVLSVNAYINS